MHLRGVLRRKFKQFFVYQSIIKYHIGCFKCFNALYSDQFGIARACTNQGNTRFFNLSFNIYHDCTSASLFILTLAKNASACLRYAVANSSEGSFLFICSTRSLKVVSSISNSPFSTYCASNSFMMPICLPTLIFLSNNNVFTKLIKTL